MVKEDKIEPFVAVWMVTYNHADYIEQAVESVMMQKTNFKYKLFIGEDYSTDKTREICMRLKEKYPDKIDLFLQNENMGPFKNAQKIYKLCFESGAKYIALCEGDDYWTDSLKLKKQVDFLEKNSEYNFSLSAFHTIDKNGKIEMGELFRKKTNPLLIRDYIAKRFSQTSTFVFRNNFEFPSWFSEIYAADQGLLFLATKDKKIKYHKELFSVYRLHIGGIDTLNNNYSERNKKYIFLLENIKSLTGDWKCKVIISFKIHVILIKNFGLNTCFEPILKVYTGVMNKLIIPVLNRFLNII